MWFAENMDKLQLPRDQADVYVGVGEYFQEDEWLDVLPDKLEEGVEWKKSLEVELFADPNNEHDENAVELRVKGKRLGFLAADDAKFVSPKLLALKSKYGMVTVRGSLWAIKRDSEVHKNISVYIPSVIDPEDPSFGKAASSGGRALKAKSFRTAWTLSLFVGWLGIDRFYLGRAGLGWAKLLTIGGAGIWWLIDLVLLATGGLIARSGQRVARASGDKNFMLVTGGIFLLLSILGSLG